MKNLKIVIGGVCACFVASAQVPVVRPQVAGRAVQEGQVTVVYLAPRFATAIRMPDAVNSVVLGDPDSFTAEHSEREPQIVFVKPITAKAAQTNLLISTAHGYQANLLLISRGEAAGMQPDVDFMMRYRPAGRFVIEPSAPTVSVAQTVALPTSARISPPVPCLVGFNVPDGFGPVARPRNIHVPVGLEQPGRHLDNATRPRELDLQRVYARLRRPSDCARSTRVRWSRPSHLPREPLDQTLCSGRNGAGPVRPVATGGVLCSKRRWRNQIMSGLNITHVHRNLHTRVTFLYLEFEDAFVILGIAALTNVFGRFLHREIAGIPLNVFLQYVVPVLAIPMLIAFKYGKPRRYLFDCLEWHTKPRIYCGIERDSQQKVMYLKEDEPECL